MRKLLIGFIVVVVVGVPLYFRFHHKKTPQELAYAGNREVTVWSTTAQVRSPLATVSFGDKMDVVSRFGDQVQVRTANGVTGWVSDHELLTAEFWQRAKDLNATTSAKPIEARGRTRVLSNMHLDPGRDSPRIRQVNKNVAVDLYERRVVPVPFAGVTKTADEEGSAAPGDANPGARKEDWWLVRAHLPDQTEMSGWILGRFIDLQVPAPLPDYASAADMRIVAWFELNHVPDDTGGMKPQYLVLGVKGSEGQACDFTMMRVFTWGKARERYETAFVESDVCGKLPLKLAAGTAPGGDASFGFEDLWNGAPEQRLYHMHQTIVRRVRAEGEAAPVKRAKGTRKTLAIRDNTASAHVPTR
ncbi:MAG TPA: SH3 domain-containing protein [Candidatus Acidoferrales bacterium]|jgi:hypothetical protein|nr:SH3 domain-containing protein [Candidatus Acidoferrales bacterium]